MLETVAGYGESKKSVETVQEYAFRGRSKE